MNKRTLGTVGLIGMIIATIVAMVYYTVTLHTPPQQNFSATDELIREALARKEAADSVEALGKMVECNALVSDLDCRNFLRRLSREKDIVSALTKIYKKDLFIWVSAAHPNRVDEDGWVVLYYKSSTEDIKRFLGLERGKQK